MARRLAIFFVGLACAGWVCADDAPTPARFFDAAAHISFTIPEAWDFELAFSSMPLVAWTTPEGARAEVWYRPGDPIGGERLRTELSLAELEDYARRDIGASHPNARILAAENRTLDGRNAFEATWSEDAPEPTEAQSVYAFIDDRYVVLTLKAKRDAFPWQVPTFQQWLNTVELLGRRDTGALAIPAHGGIWLQRALGGRIAFPAPWLIGTADDRQVGAAFAEEARHSTLTVTAEPIPAAEAHAVNAKTKANARADLLAEGFQLTAESEEPFHGYPAYRVAFEGYRKTHFVKGVDLWVVSPKARWLISIEGDGPLFNRQADDYRRILDGFEFL